MVRKYKKWLLVGLFLLALALGVIFLPPRAKPAASNYDECVKNGGAILLSYPSQCNDPVSHKSFPNPREHL